MQVIFNDPSTRIIDSIVRSIPVPMSTHEEFKEKLDQRKILKPEGHDQLRWGNNNEGVLNLKEAKLILLDLNSQFPDKPWLNLWRR